MQCIWKIIGASVQGKAHLKTRTPCQDAHAYRVLPDGTAILAVADGAGSAERSGEGAICAVEKVVETLEMHWLSQTESEETGLRSLLHQAFSEARTAVLALPEGDMVSARDFACTLTVVIAVDHLIGSAQIGDGAAVVGSPAGDFIAITQPQRGEYANETYFLTGSDALEKVEIQFYDQPVNSLTLMTDGVAHLALHVRDNQPHAKFFKPLVEFVSRTEGIKAGNGKLQAFLSSTRVSSRTHDDKTLIVAVRCEEDG